MVDRSQPTSKVGSHRLHYYEDIFFHLSQFMTKFNFKAYASVAYIRFLYVESRAH